jgi:hypothetical protein
MLKLNKKSTVKQVLTLSMSALLMAAFGCHSSTETAFSPISKTVLVENSGMDCLIPSLPEYNALPVINTLPDPFLSLNGERIQKKSDWRCRRAETSTQFQKYELGEKPPKPQHVYGMATSQSITVTVKDKGKSISFDASIHLPSTGQAPYPAMITMGRFSLNQQLLNKLGVAIINFPNNELGEQLNGGSRGKGKFFDIYGREHSASAMIAWSWGVSRLIDALETTPGANIDVTRLGVTGCSRNGKGALVAGALDERITLTIPQESGSGGSASWRVSDAQQVNGQNVQTLSQIVTENVWLRESFKQFSHTASKLSVDHHQLMGLIAPRALLVIENTSMEWLGNISTHTTAVVAQEIWKSMGLAENMGASQVGGHNHCQYPDSQLPELHAFVQKFLVGGGTGGTNFMQTDGDFTVDKHDWVKWETPLLR